jgi:hypothetical protein
MDDTLIAIERVLLNKILVQEVNTSNPNWDKINFLNIVIKEELEPFDFTHKIMLRDHLKKYSIDFTVEEDENKKIILKIPEDMQESLIKTLSSL